MSMESSLFDCMPNESQEGGEKFEDVKKQRTAGERFVKNPYAKQEGGEEKKEEPVSAEEIAAIKSEVGSMRRKQESEDQTVQKFIAKKVDEMLDYIKDEGERKSLGQIYVNEIKYSWQRNGYDGLCRELAKTKEAIEMRKGAK